MRIALGIEYSGESYCGWQSQKNSPSVQQTVEIVLSKIANQPIKLFCAGRTDTGVHATFQVAHFDITVDRPMSAWLRGANNTLPQDVSIIWAQQVNEDFHARFSAVSRRYRYIIQNSEHPPAILANKVSWYRRRLNAESMHLGAQYLLGKQDFKSFQASSCQANTSIRTIGSAQVKQHNQLIFIDIEANAFLHHMIRNIVGALLKVGDGCEQPHYIEKIIAFKDRTKAPDTAKPHGLYLVGVGYPEEFHIPKAIIAPLNHSMS